MCTCVSVCSCQPYRSSLGGRLSLLSAPHVSQANILIHSAYLPSICLHYNHSRIIGFLLCSQIGIFISESFLVLRSLHLKLPCRQVRALHDTHTHVQPQVLSMHLKNKSCHCRAERENSSRGGREGEEAGGLPDNVRPESDHPTLLCEISDDIKRCLGGGDHELDP